MRKSFISVSILKITEVAHINSLLFSAVHVVDFGKKGLGYILGDFFSQTHLVTLSRDNANDVVNFFPASEKCNNEETS
jgi:hypothetical protein